jgi:hypothetical protein
MILWSIQGHDGPANSAQQRVDLRGQAAISLAPFDLIGSGPCPSCDDTAIQEHSNRPVPGEPSLEMFVEMRAIERDDDELPNVLRWVVVSFRRRVTVPRKTRRGGLPQEPRERCPRFAPAGWARRGANFKALVAIETQGELSQREMNMWRKLSYLADHRGVPPGAGPRPNELSTATVTSAGRPTLSRLTSS